MGILSAFRLVGQASQLSPTGTPAKSSGIVSPFSDSQLDAIVWADIVGKDVLPLTRADAMTVPAVAKARHTIVTFLAGVPLVAMRGPDILPDDAQPTFLYRTNGASTPWHRMAWTIDDLVFYGWSLWWTSRGSEGQVLDGGRVPFARWGVNAKGRITIDDVVQSEDQVLLLPGPGEGLLENAGRTIRACADVERAWAGRVKSPIPVTELHQATDDQLDDDEIDDLVADYVKARQDPNGAVVYTPHDIELKVHGDVSVDVLDRARNAARLDVANFTALPAEALDGSLSTASLTYTTQEGTRTDLSDALRYWREPIEARLSQDDVVPRGQRVRFNAADNQAPTPTPTGPTVED